MPPINLPKVSGLASSDAPEASINFFKQGFLRLKQGYDALKPAQQAQIKLVFLSLIQEAQAQAASRSVLERVGDNLSWDSFKKMGSESLGLAQDLGEEALLGAEAAWEAAESGDWQRVQETALSTAINLVDKSVDGVRQNDIGAGLLNLVDDLGQDLFVASQRAGQAWEQKDYQALAQGLWQDLGQVRRDLLDGVLHQDFSHTSQQVWEASKAGAKAYAAGVQERWEQGLGGWINHQQSMLQHFGLQAYFEIKLQAGASVVTKLLYGRSVDELSNLYYYQGWQGVWQGVGRSLQGRAEALGALPLAALERLSAIEAEDLEALAKQADQRFGTWEKSTQSLGRLGEMASYTLQHYYIDPQRYARALERSNEMDLLGLVQDLQDEAARIGGDKAYAALAKGEVKAVDLLKEEALSTKEKLIGSGKILGAAFLGIATGPLAQRLGVLAASGGSKLGMGLAAQKNLGLLATVGTDSAAILGWEAGLDALDDKPGQKDTSLAKNLALAVGVGLLGGRRGLADKVSQADLEKRIYQVAREVQKRSAQQVQAGLEKIRQSLSQMFSKSPGLPRVSQMSTAHNPGTTSSPGFLNLPALELPGIGPENFGLPQRPTAKAPKAEDPVEETRAIPKGFSLVPPKPEHCLNNDPAIDIRDLALAHGKRIHLGTGPRPLGQPEGLASFTNPLLDAKVVGAKESFVLVQVNSHGRKDILVLPSGSLPVGLTTASLSLGRRGDPFGPKPSGFVKPNPRDLTIAEGQYYLNLHSTLIQSYPGRLIPLGNPGDGVRNIVIKDPNTGNVIYGMRVADAGPYQHSATLRSLDQLSSARSKTLALFDYMLIEGILVLDPKESIRVRIDDHGNLEVRLYMPDLRVLGEAPPSEVEIGLMELEQRRQDQKALIRSTRRQINELIKDHIEAGNRLANLQKSYATRPNFRLSSQIYQQRFRVQQLDLAIKKVRSRLRGLEETLQVLENFMDQKERDGQGPSIAHGFQWRFAQGASIRQALEDYFDKMIARARRAEGAAYYPSF